MIIVVVGNSVCSVSGLSAQQFKDVRLLMSYTEVARLKYRRRFGSTRKYLIDKRGEFPTGLLYILEEYLATKVPAASVEFIDKRIRPPMRQLGLETMFVSRDSLTPYPEQSEAATVARDGPGRGIVVGPTGVGKSFVAALIIDAIQVPTLVVVPTLPLKRQLTESLRELFGKDRVGPMDRGKRKFFITVENVDALDPKKPIKGIDMVLIDEFHHSGADTYRKLNRQAWNDVYLKFGLTATPFRSKSDERLLLESVLSKVIYRIPYDTAVQKGYIVPMETYYVNLPTVTLKCKGNNWHAVYSECVVKNEHRNRAVVDMAANLHAAGKSTLILVKQIEHGLRLQEMLADEGIEVPLAKGENDNNSEMIADFNSLKTPVLIGTMGVIGEGVDTKPCEYVLLAGGGKARGQFMQNCGRGFRRFGDKSSCKIIMFRDNSHKWLVEHFKACLKTLREEYGAVPACLST